MLTPSLGLDHFAAALKDDGLGSVECSEISGATGIIVKTGGEHSLTAFKVVIGIL